MIKNPDKYIDGNIKRISFIGPKKAPKSYIT